jgi:hypothetical protein
VNQIKINSIVKKDNITGIVVSIVCETAHVWWNAPGRYHIEPHDISTLRIVENEEVRV